MSALHTPEAIANQRAARQANIAQRSEPGSAVWSRYAGRKGWVAVVNAQEFDNGTKYVEVGVSWALREDLERMGADTWFRADELVRA